jgi:hypothetical protein
VSAGDLPKIAACWEVPALVLGDQEAVAVGGLGEVEAFFGRAVEAYRSQGLFSTTPELEQVDTLSDRLAAVDVRWAALDKAGVDQSSERSHYILHVGDDHQPRIRVALTRTQ